MKNGRRILVCLLLVALFLAMTGCGAQDEWEAAKKAAGRLGDTVEDPQLREDTKKMLDALIADDFDAAYSLVADIAGEAEFRSAYRQLQAALEGLGDYELTASYINKNVTNGVATTGVRYMLTAGERRMFVEATRVEGYDGLRAFYINDYNPVYITGTLGNMRGADALQWIFLIVGLLEWVFVAAVFVDCCRHKMKRKWLWLLFVALGYLVIGLIITPEQFRISFDVGAFLNYTSLIRYSTGGFTARIMVPLGAVIYLCLRKSLFAKYVELQQQKAMAEQTAMPPEEIPEVSDSES